MKKVLLLLAVLSFTTTSFSASEDATCVGQSDIRNNVSVIAPEDAADKGEVVIEVDVNKV